MNHVSDIAGLTLVLGCMYSGKTTELLRLLRRYQHAQCHCLLLRKSGSHRPALDEPGLVVARDTGARMACSEVDGLSKQLLQQDIDVYGIDEAQFMPGLTEFCEAALLQGKHVIVAYLSGSHQQRPFQSAGEGNSLSALIALATRIIKLEAVCSCGADAHYTLLKDADNKNEVVVDSNNNAYVSVCLHCLLRIREERGCCELFRQHLQAALFKEKVYVGETDDSRGFYHQRHTFHSSLVTVWDPNRPIRSLQNAAKSIVDDVRRYCTDTPHFICNLRVSIADNLPVSIADPNYVFSVEYCYHRAGSELNLIDVPHFLGTV